MRRLVLGLLLLAPPAWAGEWRTLTGPEISAALTARVLAYQGGAVQSFFADGRTHYAAGPPGEGRWRVEADRYCSVWPPSERWECYAVEALGLDIRFVAGGSGVTLGRFVVQ